MQMEYCRVSQARITQYSLYISHNNKSNISLFYSNHCFNLPNDELHLASASGVHKDWNQLWVTGAKNAMRPDGNSEKTLLLITRLKHYLKHKHRR